MRLFNFLKNILLEIYQEDKLPDFESLRKKRDILILRRIQERGLEQKILAQELKKQNLPENFYAYILWIAGEITNNIFDHGQTLGKTLKGGVLAMDIKNNILQLAIGDLGIGIKASLDKNPELQKQKLNAEKAIKLALTENTSGWPYKRGNGLPDVLRVVKAGKGKFMIYSDTEDLPGVIVGVELKIHDFKVPRKSQPKGKIIKLSQFGKQLSGREKGQEAYEALIHELTKLPKAGVLIIDLTKVIMMNSSFGDQALGVLLENIKQGHFGAKKIFFSGEIKEPVDFCLDRIAEIRNVEIIKI